MNMEKEEREAIAKAEIVNQFIKNRPKIESKIDLSNLAEKLAERRAKNKKK